MSIRSWMPIIQALLAAIQLLLEERNQKEPTAD